jgi:phosphoglycolate phosphatase
MTGATHGSLTGTELVCCGLFGTVVPDDGIIERSYAEAIATQGVVSGTSSFARRMAQVHQARGQAPASVLRRLFPDNEARAQAAELAFGRALSDGLRRVAVRPAAGAAQTLARLRESGRKVCIVTSLPRTALDTALAATGLSALADFSLSCEDVARGFPWPDLVLTALLRTGTGSVCDVAVVHSTGAGVEAGRRSGAGLVAGVLSGPHAAARLRSSGATHILGSIADLPRLLSAPADDAVTGSPGPASRGGPAGRGGAGSTDGTRRTDGTGSAGAGSVAGRSAAAVRPAPAGPPPAGISVPAQVGLEGHPLGR